MENNYRIHFGGAALFLFIPLVLFLFLQFPFGIIPSFIIAVFLMITHRFIAKPFFMRNLSARCFWCGRTGRARTELAVRSNDEQLLVQLCRTGRCEEFASRFFGFTESNKLWIRTGIFIPLLWYVVTMFLNALQIIRIPVEWERFIFQFFIAVTVVTISFAFRLAAPAKAAKFSFPMHNLFLLGVRNTLLVFRFVGLWWIVTSLIFLWRAGLQSAIHHLGRT